MPTARLVRCVTCAVSLLVASIAHATPVERMADIAVHPSNPDVMVVRYLNGGTGLLYTTDGGNNFRLLCASAISSDKQTGPIAITNDGPLLMGEFNGLWIDDGKGCGWSKAAPLAGRWITDLAVDPADETRTIAVTGNGDPGSQNGISRRDAAGDWTEVGSRAPVTITRVRITKAGNALRIYESAIRIQTSGDAGALETTYLIRVSDDEGQTWKEHDVAVTNGSFRLEAIDPSDPDRIVGSFSPTGGSVMPGTADDPSMSNVEQLLVSRDQGATFSPYGEITELGALVMAPDGRIWVGEPQSLSMPDASHGLWFAENLGAPLTKVADYGVECLAYLPQRASLVGCQAHTFGKIDPKTGAFTELFHLRDIQEFVACDGDDVAGKCQGQLCAAYCGAGHFAQALLCCTYETSTACGPSIAEIEGTGSRSMCLGGAADSGMPITGSDAGPAAGSGADADGKGGASGSGGAAGSTAGTEPKDDQHDCSCGALGATPRNPPANVRLALLLLLIAVPRFGRRMRRVTAARTASETSH
jgi:hypothetical protein